MPGGLATSSTRSFDIRSTCLPRLSGSSCPAADPGISLTLRRASTGRPVLRCQRAPQRLEYGDGNDVEAGDIALLGRPLNHQFNQSHTNWPALDMHAGPGARGRDESGFGRTIACGVLSD